MTKTCLLLLMLAPLAIFQAAPASACKVVGYKNGEPLCAKVSDGAGQRYTDGRSARDKHLAHIRARLERARQARRTIAHQDAKW
jgi:hypothetical protein